MPDGRRIVISQPFHFPWIGQLEQIALSDVYVHYDDVQFSKGSFTNRVQIKTADGFKWLTIPLEELRLGMRIDEVRTNDDMKKDWRSAHLEFLEQTYDAAPFRDEMLELVREVYEPRPRMLCDIVIDGVMALARYFGLTEEREFLRSSEMNIPGKSSQRVADIVDSLGGTVYYTGHGARRYLDHELLEARGVRIEYMDYAKTPYPQLYGEFNPYVSSLDLVANVGKAGAAYIRPRTRYWREFVGA